MNRTQRRAVRTAIYAITQLLGLCLLAWLTARGQVDRILAVGLLGIVGLSTIGYVAENVTQRISFHIGADGAYAEIGGEDEKNT